jgi:probable HAF family extracellular repeat protein
MCEPTDDQEPLAGTLTGWGAVVVTPAVVSASSAGLSASTSATAAKGQGGWRVIELELLPGGHRGSAEGVNDDGVVVGVSETADLTNHAVLWREGRITDLGTLGGWDSAAADVNRHGVVIGWSETRPSRVTRIHPFVWTDGRMTDLGTLGGGNAWAEAINDDGWVVGFSETTDRAQHAFVWQAGEMTDLGIAHRSSRAYGIDNRGRIVGASTVEYGNTVPVMWEQGQIRQLTDRYGRATAINSGGQVAGCLSTGSQSFLWSQEHLTEIGPVEGAMDVVVDGIDQLGRVLGHADLRAFVWHGGEFGWLPGLTSGYSSARAISDQGRFAVGVSASTPDGLIYHPVVWDPAVDVVARP